MQYLLAIALLFSLCLVPLGTRATAHGIRSLFVRRQKRLLEECRRIFILGVQALSNGEQVHTRKSLDEIRVLEARWRYGDSTFIRALVVLVAFVAATVAGAVLTLAWLMFVAIEWDSWERTLDRWSNLRHSLADYRFYVFFLIHGALFGLAAVLGWPKHVEVDDCGDRLQAFIDSPRGVTPFREEQRAARWSLDGLDAFQVLGLSKQFSRKQLDAARRRLAKEFHPDKWLGASAAMRSAAEAAMKRVNAAYDELLPSANG